MEARRRAGRSRGAWAGFGLALLCLGVGRPGAADGLAYQQAFQRGTQAVIWGIPAVSLVALRKGAERDLGAGDNDVVFFSHPLEPRHRFLTPNHHTPYVIAFLNLAGGPVVMEVPPAGEAAAFRGGVVDAWQRPVVDVGPSGADAGKGGRYVFLPPGYEPAPPDDAIAVPVATTHLYVALRTIAPGGAADAAAYAKRLVIRPLAASGGRAPGRYIDAYPKSLNTLPAYDLTYFDDLLTVINEEPVQERDKVMMGMLASIGMERGKPFRPEGDAARVLEQAVRAGYDAMQQTFETPGRALVPQWPGSRWQRPNLPEAEAEHGFAFETSDALLLDERAGGFYFWARFLPRKLATDSATLIALRDAGGENFAGTARYRLRVPKDVPAGDFWSVLAYSSETKAFIPSSENRPGLSSADAPALKANPDGSLDIYFGSHPPEGLESNWVPSAGEDFFLIFRLYGLGPAFSDGTWRLPDVERVP